VQSRTEVTAASEMSVDPRVLEERREYWPATSRNPIHYPAAEKWTIINISLIFRNLKNEPWYCSSETTEEGRAECESGFFSTNYKRVAHPISAWRFKAQSQQYY